MLQFEESTFERLKNKKNIIIGTEKGARLIRELLLFRECETAGFLDVNMQKELKCTGSIPVLKLDDIARFDEDTILFTSIALKQADIMNLENRGYSYDAVYDMLPYTRGGIPDYLLNDALEYIKLRGGEWEHCKTLFKYGIDILEGGISKCLLADNLLILEGWLLPGANYKEIQVFLNNTFVGNAELGKIRKDIKKKYPVFNDENTGFYLETPVDGIKNGSDYNCAVKATDGNVFVWEGKRKVNSVEISEVVSDLAYRHEYEKLFLIASKYMKICADDNKLKTALDCILGSSDNCYEKINIYQVIYRLGFFSSSYMGGYIEEIEKVNDVWTKLWLREQDIPWMLFYYPQYAVKSIYKWERRVMEGIGKQLREEKGSLSTISDISKESNHVIIVVEGLADETAASAIFELEIANTLAEKGYKVTVCVLDTSYFEKEVAVNTIVKRKRNSIVNREYHLKAAKKNVEIWYCKGTSLRERIRTAIEEIEKKRPEFILDISLGGTAVAAVFHGEIPVLHIPLTGYSSGAVFDAYIAKSKLLCMQENKIFDSIEESRIFEAPINIPYNIRSRKIYYRDELGLEDDDFILVTVGNRLKYEMDTEFVGAVKDLLGRNQKYKWIIVGKDLSEEFHTAANELIKSGQIRLWGFENDLSALYKICNVYLNPNRVGGCGSIELAMEMELPVALTDFPSDVLPIIGAKNCCGSYYNDIIQYIEKIYKSPRLYTHEGKKFYSLLKRRELTMEYYVDVIIAAYQEVR